MAFDLVHYMYRKYPNLKKEILMAHMKISPQDFIKKNLINAFLISVILSFFSMFILRKFVRSSDFAIPDSGVFMFCMILVCPILFFLLFAMLLGAPVGVIKKRRKDIEKEVLFAGRFLLIKLNSGQPLLNALIDASKSYGVAAKYFKEIVDDITLGMPLEEALERAMSLTPSPAFQKILFQINNSLTIGVDVTETLKSVLDDITNEQLTEIDAYNHKLNTVALMYMLTAVVAPSLGLTIFVVVSGMIGFQINTQLYGLLWLFVVFIQLVFINVFRSIRPNINF